jgi:hypothetical protein
MVLCRRCRCVCCSCSAAACGCAAGMLCRGELCVIMRHLLVFVAAGWCVVLFLGRGLALSGVFAGACECGCGRLCDGSVLRVCWSHFEALQLIDTAASPVQQWLMRLQLPTNMSRVLCSFWW